jgi:hypothetical protein
VQHDALDHVVRGVREGHDISAGLDASAVEERVAKLAGRRLHGAFRQRLLAPLGKERHPESCAEIRDLFGHVLRPAAERVVVMRGDDVVP